MSILVNLPLWDPVLAWVTIMILNEPVNHLCRVPGKHFRQTMYRTGDLVEKASNGYLYFKGRVDNQIKHMGYRIELEEVEAAFSPGLRK